MRFNTNVQNICKLQPFTYKLDIITMRKLLLLFSIIILFSCEKNETNDILPDVPVNITINTDLPQFINLQTPTGYAETSGGIKGILILNTGLTPLYKAYDRACPNNDCSSAMIFDGSLKMKCPCDNSEYSIIDGSPQTSGNIHFAREYRVNQINPSTLNITNF
ncbi:MAG: phosphoribosylaminoimidazole carboxylase [Lutibacter sp.]|uniref:phosphoribosylaminoimidazole carboxylase n=1 Tax=Lutibacter sp. TaxID=1925666 RepID=UPI00385B6129